MRLGEKHFAFDGGISHSTETPSHALRIPWPSGNRDAGGAGFRCMVTGRRRRPRRGARIAIVAVLGLALLGGVAAVAASGGGDGTRSGGAETGEGAGGEEGSFAQGDVLPGSLTIEMFDGQTETLADFRGQPLVLNFFASWCPPCLAEMPDFETVHQEVDGEVAFLGAAMQDDSRELALGVVEQTGVTYELAWDPAGELFRAFGGFNMPTTVFIDADGRFVNRHNGILTIDQLRAAVEDLKA
jgi:cytochrome c biogenesis protein CcmG, thiol:disulfide interchange protein DsbE